MTFKPGSAAAAAVGKRVVATPITSTVESNSANLPSLATSVLHGLTVQEQQEVGKNRQILAKVSPATVMAYGNDLQAEYTALADQMLEHSGVHDVDFIGDAMTKIVMKTKGVNMNSINGDKSKVPLIGGLIDKFRINKERVTSQFEGAKDYIEKMASEVGKVGIGLAKAVEQQELLYEANKKQYRKLELLMMGLKVSIEEHARDTAIFEESLKNQVNPDPFDVQQLSDGKAYLRLLEKKLSNFEGVAMSVVQAAPQIRMIQESNLSLCDTISMIQGQLVPQFKKNFTQALTIRDTKSGAELANMVLDLNNEMARQNAEMLGQTQVAVAKIAQRGVYDLSTLEFVTKTLIDTSEKCQQIAAEGAAQRKLMSQRCVEMKQELKTKLA